MYPGGVCLIYTLPGYFVKRESIRFLICFDTRVTTEVTSVSTHALLAESDGGGQARCVFIHIFLSTLSLRRATNSYFHSFSSCNISIHALLAESDNFAASSTEVMLYFYPRSPCGERPRPKMQPRSPLQFLSTLSLRRATLEDPAETPETTEFLSTLSLRRATEKAGKFRAALYISIHALLAESDILSDGLTSMLNYFYPRSPCGERQNISGL